MRTISVSFLLAFACACTPKKEFRSSVAVSKQKPQAVPSENVQQPFPQPAQPQPFETYPQPSTSYPQPEVVMESQQTPEQKPSANTVDSSSAIELLEGSQSFAVATGSTNEVDMYWVIDNSTSMDNEVALVRKNLENFMASISKRLDIKVTLISSADEAPHRNGMTLSAEAKAAGHRQLDITIASYSAINVLAASLCPEGSSNIPTAPEFNAFWDISKWQRFAISEGEERKVESSPFKICGVPTLLETELREASVYFGKSKMRGTLKPRPKAAQVVVVVTDDDAIISIPSQGVEKTLGFSPGSMHLFGFIGIESKPDCKIARRGEWYEKVAKASGGSVFDICDADWTAHFSKLSEQVVQVAGSQFTVEPRKGLTIKAVQIDGKDVPTDAYVISGNSVSFKNPSILKSGKTVVVKFSYEK